MTGRAQNILKNAVSRLDVGEWGIESFAYGNDERAIFSSMAIFLSAEKMVRYGANVKHAPVRCPVERHPRYRAAFH